MAGFCEFAAGLHAPKLAVVGAKSPKVSGGYLKYSRFWETATGDGFDQHCAADAAVRIVVALAEKRREPGFGDR
jgi:hypothetical protein